MDAAESFFEKIEKWKSVFRKIKTQSVCFDYFSKMSVTIASQSTFERLLLLLKELLEERFFE